ncbi:hypothetical protein [Streptomyces hygroscopicus]|uniref:hypothetical protein n=1 Tax=Streptomyces hygroscopicus TaxID=1912 RepID=UPI0036A63FFB
MTAARTATAAVRPTVRNADARRAGRRSAEQGERRPAQQSAGHGAADETDDDQDRHARGDERRAEETGHRHGRGQQERQEQQDPAGDTVEKYA